MDACLLPEPELRPSLAELHGGLQAALPSLDGQRPVPPPRADERPEPGPAGCGSPSSWRSPHGAWRSLWWRRSSGARGSPWSSGALTAPAILVASRLAWAALPVLAPLLGALSVAPVYPAAAGSRGTALERGVLGALGWCWLLVGAAALGVGSDFGLIDTAPDGWSRSTADAASALLSPLLTPEALLGAAVFALAAVALGVILRAGHVALALLGALLWSAGLEAGLQLVADGGGLTDRPLLIAAAALVAVIVEFRLRPPASRPARPAPIPRRSRGDPRRGIGRAALIRESRADCARSFRRTAL